MYDKGKQLLSQDFDVINMIRQQKASSTMLDSNMTSPIVQQFLPNIGQFTLRLDEDIPEEKEMISVPPTFDNMTF